MELGNWTILKDVISLVLAVFGAGAIVWKFQERRQSKTDERLNDGVRKFENHDTRIEALERTVKAMPTHADMEKQSGMLAVLNEKITGLATQISIIQDTLSRRDP